MLLSAATAIVFGLAPALQIASRTAIDHLRTHGAVDRRGARLRRVLVVAETASALVLVVAAALLIKTLVRLRAIDPGFRADHVLTAQITVPYPKYRDPDRRRSFYSEVLARVDALPGVERAGLTSDLPYTARANYQSLKIENQAGEGSLGQDALFRLVSPGYLQTMGARLRAGRFLDERDRNGALPAVVVNESLARTYWPGESALGHRIDTGTGDGSPLWMTVVGVVEDVKERGLDYGPKPAVYVPFTQTTIAFYQPSEIAVRTSVPPARLATALQQAVWAIDPEQPVSTIRTMEQIVDTELSNRQEMLSLFATFAGMALLLAALGVYSLLSYLVSERRREIGVRMAVGASAGMVQRAILGQSARLAAVAIAVGVAAALATTRSLGSLLFDVSPVDPVVMIAVSALLAGVVLVASYLPARRAAAMDPMVVLRAE
jgi:putative ABC transport system permease protein